MVASKLIQVQTQAVWPVKEGFWGFILDFSHLATRSYPKKSFLIRSPALAWVENVLNGTLTVMFDALLNT